MEACWHQDRIKNRCQLRKADFAKTIVKPMNFQWFFKVMGLKLASKINQKSIKNWSPRWIASWHRFLVDFGGFWEACWPPKSSQERKKIDWKTHRKNDEKKMRFGSAQGGWGNGRANTTQGFCPPPNYQLPTTNTTPQPTDHSPQASRTLSHALRAKRGGGYIYIYVYI